MHFDRPNLTLVIDRRLYRPQGEGQPPLSLVEAAIEGGITMLQLRLGAEAATSGSGGGEDLAAYAIAQRLREMTDGRVPFLITADLELADRSRADGVLLIGERSYRPSDAKEYLSARPHTLIGYYAEAVPGAARAERGGADFVQVGPVFESEVTDDSAGGNEADALALIRKVKDAINLPIVAFGGIDTPERAAASIKAGADGVAVSQAILGAPDPRAAAQALRQAIEA